MPALFQFTLTPLELIQPWGEPGEYCLHWFGLTDGQYWMEVGANMLFEYSENARGLLGISRYCDYQVVRLYEDVLEMVPHVLEPVPSSLVKYLSGDMGRAWDEKASSWYSEGCERLDDDRFWEIADDSLAWIGSRTLDTGYLSPSTKIRMWSDQSLVHVEWDNTEKLIQGSPAWSASRGIFCLSRAKFLAEVLSFHTRLMKQMSERVEKVLAGALPPEVQVDFSGLQREQSERSRSIETALKELVVPTNWQSVTEAIHEIERNTFEG